MGYLSVVTALRLDNQLCFALYSASRAMTSAYRPVLDELGLTYPQYLVLLVLWEEDRSTVRHLGKRLQLDSGTLSPLLKRLEAGGFVRRERSATDERSVEITLTESGRELEAEVQCVPENAFGATGLTSEEVMNLRDAVQRFNRALHEAGNSTDS